METKDILLFETGSGGDFSIENDDLVMVESLYQQMYLAMFGGNIEASTKITYLDSEIRTDYWGNSLIWKNDKIKQFNSETERAIQNNTLNSLGRLAILQAVKTDLEYLKPIINFDVQISLLSREKLQITIPFSEISNQQNKLLQLVFNNAKNEIIIDKII